MFEEVSEMKPMYPACDVTLLPIKKGESHTRSKFIEEFFERHCHNQKQHDDFCDNICRFKNICQPKPFGAKVINDKINIQALDEDC